MTSPGNEGAVDVGSIPATAGGMCIYALVDPREPERVRYVGKAVDLKRREAQHVSYATRGRKKYPVCVWICSLLAEGVRPIVVFLSSTSAERRQFERIVFRPGAEAGPRELNLWTGLGLEPEEPIGRFAHVRITAHIFNVICGGGKDHYKYMMNWLAHIVQKPAEKPGVAVVLKGKKGVGKDTLALLMARIVGKRHYTHIDKPDALVGRFNAQFERSIFVHVEEAFWSGDRAKKGVLQSMITSPTMEVERKGFDVITRDSFVRLMMTTNERWAIPASDDERRYFVLDVPETYRNDFDYFDGLYDEINGDAARGFLHTLKSIDLTGWNPRKVPQTNALLHQKLESLEGFDAWWFDMLSSATLPSVERKFDDRGRIYEQATKIDWETKKNAPPEGINVAKEWMRQSYAKFLRARKFEGDPIHDVEFGHKMSAARSVPAKGQIDATDKRRPIYRVKSLDEARALFAARVGGDASMWVEHKDEEEKTREEEDASGFPAL